jgi:hypothetical protein
MACANPRRDEAAPRRELDRRATSANTDAVAKRGGHRVTEAGCELGAASLEDRRGRGGAAGRAQAERGAMPQIFGPRADTIARLLLLAIPTVPTAGVLLTYALMRSPYVTGQEVTLEQPVPFSHEHHVGDDGIDCRYCHTSVERSAFAGLPPTETCMTCHSQLWTQAPVLAPVRRSLAEGIRLRWRRVNDLPGYVYFNHSIHVAKGVGCSTCHGPVDTMPLMRQAAPLTMGWCLACHRDPAPYLRPREAVYDQHWQPPADQAVQGRRLIEAYHVSTAHLTDCSVCHR